MYCAAQPWQYRCPHPCTAAVEEEELAPLVLPRSGGGSTAAVMRSEGCSIGSKQMPHVAEPEAPMLNVVLVEDWRDGASSPVKACMQVCKMKSFALSNWHIHLQSCASCIQPEHDLRNMITPLSAPMCWPFGSSPPGQLSAAGVGEPHPWQLRADDP